MFPTAWARTPAAIAARAFILRAGFGSILRSEVTRQTEGLDVFEGLRPPVLFVANHQSHLDAPVIMTSLPPKWMDRTAVGAAADYFFDVWWRAAATALAFNAFPVERARGQRSARVARTLLLEGWNILIFPQATRSHDGWITDFKAGAAVLSSSTGVPVVPVALRGTYQAMPRGRGWPRPGRPPVRVRFGRPVRPEAGERPGDYSDRIRRALEATIHEDRAGWWRSRRDLAVGEVPGEAGPDAADWRRKWESSRPLPRESRVWR